MCIFYTSLLLITFPLPGPFRKLAKYVLKQNCYVLVTPLGSRMACPDRVSSGSIVSDYGLDDRAIGVRFPAGAKDFFPLSSVSRPALGPTQPPVQWVPGVLSPGVKARPGRDADHSPPSSAEVENE
jgi:hypothetical protein